MNIRTRTTSLGSIGVLASSLLLGATSASAGDVGYYDLFTGRGEAYQVAPITAAGENPVQLFTLTPVDLASVDVLFALNPSNDEYGAEWVAALPDITAAVNAGLVLCFAGDRRVTEAASNIPGGAGISFFRDFTNDMNIDILDNATLVTNGPGGVVTNTNLDGGNSSNHGYATTVSLPTGNTAILSDGVATQAVTFSYPQGDGSVVYSTVPTDFYLQAFGVNPPNDEFQFIYAPNMVAYCASLAVVEVPPVPPEDFAEEGGVDVGGVTVEIPTAVFGGNPSVSVGTVLVLDDLSRCGVEEGRFDIMDTPGDDDDDLVLRKEICGAPSFIVKVLETFDVAVQSGAVEWDVDSAQFFDPPFLCQFPIPLSPPNDDPRLEEIVYWQTTNNLLMPGDMGADVTKACGNSSRGRSRGLSYLAIGTYYVYRENDGIGPPQPELNWIGNPEAVEQAFIATTRKYLVELQEATDEAIDADALPIKSDRGKLKRMINKCIKLFDRSEFDSCLDHLKNYQKFVGKANFDPNITFNHNGELTRMVDHNIWMLEKYIIPYAP